MTRELSREREVIALAMTTNVLVPLNSTMLAVALPEILEDLHARIAAGGFLVTGYLIIMGLLQPFTGRLGDRVDRRSIVLVGLTWFGVASLGAGLAPSMGWLLCFRFQQAAAGALLTPNTIAMVRAVVPAERRATRLGFVGTSTGLAAAVGPGLGGLLASAGSWRWVFAVNVVPVAAALVAGVLLGRVRTASTAGASIAPTPTREVLRNPAFLAPAAANGLSNLGLYTLLLAVPLLLARRGGWSSVGIGLVTSTLTAGMAICSPFGGRLADRLGRRRPPSIGLLLLIASMAVFTFTAGEVPAAAVVALLALAGIGIGISNASLQTAALESVGHEAAGTAAGLYSTSRYVGSIIGTLVLAQLVERQAGSFAPVFAMAGVAAVLAFGSATRIRPWPDAASDDLLATSPAAQPEGDR